MKRFLLAALALAIVTAARAPAEYLIVVANLNGQKGAAVPGGAGTGEAGGAATPGVIGTPAPGTGEGTPPPDPAAEPRYVYAVVEVTLPPGFDPKQFNGGQAYRVGHRWGGSFVTKGVPGVYTLCDLVRAAEPGKAPGAPVPNIAKRYEDRYKAVHAKKPTTDQVVELAVWALEHGLLPKYTELMDKLAEDAKNTEPAVANYRKVKAELAKPAKPADAPVLGSKFLEGRKRQDGEHYVLVHNLAENAPEARRRLALLENNFKTFFHWFALKGVHLPVPAAKQVAYLGDMKEEEFQQYHKTLASTPVVADGFYTRRENLVVFSKQRFDSPYQELVLKTEGDFWSRDFNRDQLLLGKQGAGHPINATPEDFVGASMAALLLKTMEADTERAAVTHDATRQLLHATGLLPKNVHAPEWVQFGAASFFETPQGSPWTTVGLPHVEYVLLWRELKAKGKLEVTADPKKAFNPAATLKKVVTDGYFRHNTPPPPPGPPGDPAVQAGKAAVAAADRKARATAWALTYFLMQTRLDGVQRYHQELARMPRDVELSEAVLLDCFARAFECVDAKGKVDERKLDQLAKKWDEFMERTPMELEAFFVKLRDEMAKYAAPRPAAPPTGGGTTPVRP